MANPSKNVTSDASWVFMFILRLLLALSILFQNFREPLKPVSAISPDTKEAAESIHQSLDSSNSEEEKPVSRFAGPQFKPGTSALHQAKLSTGKDNSFSSSNQLKTSPLLFVENIGQYEDKVRYKIPNSDKQVLFSGNEIWINAYEAINQTSLSSYKDNILDISLDNSDLTTDPPERKEVHVRYSFVNANPHPAIEGFDRQTTKVSYLLGNDSSKWYSDIPVWGGIRYLDLYPGIDLEVTSKNGNWEWRLVVKDKKQFSSGEQLNVHLKVDGAKEVSTSGASYKAKTSIGDIDLPLLPIQFSEEKKLNVVKNPVIENNEIEILSSDTSGEELLQFDLSKSPLSTNTITSYTQSSYSIQLNSASLGAIAVDEDGTAYVVGTTSDADFPVTTGEEINLGVWCLDSSSYFCDTFVAKINPNGEILYLTFLGGSFNDYGWYVDSDNTGNVYVAGFTGSTDFPGIDSSKFLSANNVIFVTKLSDSGTFLFTTTLCGTRFSGITDFISNRVVDLKVNSENDIFITWTVDHYPTSSTDYWFSKINKTNGASQFNNRVSRYMFLFPGIGGYVYSISNSSSQIILNKYNALTGSSVSQWTYSFGTGTYGLGLYVDSNNYFYISGGIQPATGSPDITPFIFKVKPDGTLDTYIAYSEIGSWLRDITMNSAGKLIAIWRDSTSHSLYVVNSQDLSLEQKFTTCAGDCENGYFDIDEAGFIYSAHSAYQNDVITTIITKRAISNILPEDGLYGPGGDDCCIGKAYGDANAWTNGPINTRTGAMEYNTSDLAIQTTSGPLHFNRDYSSSLVGEYTQTLGYGWTHNLDSRLILPADPEGEVGFVKFKAQTVNQYRFYDNGDGTYTAYPGVNATLTALSENPYSYEIKDKAQRSYLFDAAGKLARQTDPEDHVLDYSYTDGRLTQVADTEGHSISLHYAEYQTGKYRIDYIYDHANRYVYYGYDSSTGDLTSAIDVRGQTWTYRYDPVDNQSHPHFLTHVFDAQANIIEHTLYNPDGKAYLQYNGAGEKVVELVYNSDGTTTVKDGLDNAETHTYDARKTLTGSTNPASATTSNTYDPNFRPATITDPLNNTTSFTWSPDGNNLESMTDALDHTTSMEYDAHNHLTLVTTNSQDPTKAVKTLSVYNTPGATDPLTSAVIYHSDWDEDLVLMVIQNYTPGGSGEGVNQITRYTYTTANDNPEPANLIRRIEAADETTCYRYNSLGQSIEVYQNCVDMNPATGNPGEDIRTSSSYDTLGRLETTTNVIGVTTRNIYSDKDDQADVVIRNYDAGKAAYAENMWNLATVYVYDPAGRLTDVVENAFDGDLNGDGQVNAALSLDLNHDNTPEYHLEIDPNHPEYNIISHTVYDAAGRVTETVSNYWPGQPAYYQNLYNRSNRIFYDGAGRVVASVANYNEANLLGGGSPAAMDFDGDSNTDATLEISVLYPEYNQITRTSYDTVGRVSKTWQTAWPGQPDYYQPSEDSAIYNIVTANEYDLAGNVIKTINNFDQNWVDADNDGYAVSLNLVPGETPTTIIVDPDAPERNQITCTEYDELNRATFVRTACVPGQPDYRTAAGNLYNLVTYHLYDVMGWEYATIRNYEDNGERNNDGVLELTNERNFIYRSYYDALGRIQYSVTNFAGDLGSSDVPAFKDPNSAVDSDRNLVSETIYAADGEAIASKDTFGRVTRTYYNDQHQPETVIQNLTGWDVQTAQPPDCTQTGVVCDATQNVRQDTHYDASGRQVATVAYFYELGTPSNPVKVTNRTYYDAVGRSYLVVSNLQGQSWEVNTPPSCNRGTPTPGQNADQNLCSETYYDVTGSVIATRDAQGVVSRRYYDAGRRMTMAVQNLGGQAIDASPYDRNNARTPDQNVVMEYVYDARGQQIAMKDNRSVTSDSARKIDRTFYNAVGQVVVVVENLQDQAIETSTLPAVDANHPDENVTTKTYYDVSGRAIKVVNPAGSAQYQCYNNQGQGIKTVINPSVSNPCQEYTVNAAADQDITISSSYDTNGNRVSTQNPNGKETSYQYDSLGRMTTEQDPLQNVTQYAYNAAGNQLTLTNAKSVVTRYEYDALGRLSAVIENYDPDPEAPVDHETNVRTVYSYDAAGNRRSILDGREKTTTFGYDALNRLTGEQDALGHTTTYGYDPAGNRAWLLDANGDTTVFHYDWLNRLQAIDYPGTEIDMSVTYNLAGSKDTLTDRTGVTSWSYDGANRVSAITAPVTGTVAYHYTAAGNRKQLIYPDNKTVNYGYDLAGRMQTVMDWNNQVPTTYHYDKAGQYDWIDLPNGLVSDYLFDDAGRLTNLAHQLQGVSLSSYHYTYDPVGNRTQAVESLGSDALASLPSQLAAEMRGFMAIGLAWPDSTIAEQGYHLERSTDGQNWQSITELGADTFRYIDEGLARHTDYWYRLTAWNNQGGNEVRVLRTETGFDPIRYTSASMRSQIINYVYDPLNRLTDANYDNGSFFHYGYDEVGNRTAETTQAGTTIYGYDDANRMSTVNGVSYTWDSNGNLRSGGGKTYSYDYANRLSSVTEGTNTTGFVYNGLGDRVKEEINGVAINFTLDLAAGLTQVLQDGTNTYLYGNERILQQSASQLGYFLGDALGSVRQLVDDNGALTLAKDYEPYGEEMSSQGAGRSNYGFTGERNSSSTNLLYLRARYYVPELGRFLTKDTWQGDSNMPMSYNVWLYVYSNPVMYFDPNGMKAKKNWRAFQRDLYMMGVDVDILRGDKEVDILRGSRPGRPYNVKMLSPTAMKLIMLNFSGITSDVCEYDNFAYLPKGEYDLNQYDELLSGWVDYWKWRADNENYPLRKDLEVKANFMKALGFGESGLGYGKIGTVFNVLPNDLNRLRGNMNESYRSGNTTCDDKYSGTLRVRCYIIWGIAVGMGWFKGDYLYDWSHWDTVDMTEMYLWGLMDLRIGDMTDKGLEIGAMTRLTYAFYLEHYFRDNGRFRGNVDDYMTDMLHAHIADQHFKDPVTDDPENESGTEDYRVKSILILYQTGYYRENGVGRLVH